MPCPTRWSRRRHGWSALSYRRERRCSCTSDSPESPNDSTPSCHLPTSNFTRRSWELAVGRWELISNARGRLLRRLTTARLARPRAVPPPHPANHHQFDRKDHERRLDHRPDNRRHCFGLDVERVPHRETSPVATLARDPVPHRERNGHELSGGERGTGVGAKRPLENDRPFSLVVARDTRDVPRIVRRDLCASLRRELKGRRTGKIEKPEIHRVLRIAENEVRLAHAGGHLRGDLDRHRVREFGCHGGWRGRFRKGILRASCRWRLAGRGRGYFLVAEDAPVRAAGARTTAPAGRCASRLLLFLSRNGEQRSVLPCLLGAHVVPSHEERDRLGIIDGLDGDGCRRRMELADRLRNLSDDRKGGDTTRFEVRGSLRPLARV